MRPSRVYQEEGARAVPEVHCNVLSTIKIVHAQDSAVVSKRKAIYKTPCSCSRQHTRAYTSNLACKDSTVALEREMTISSTPPSHKPFHAHTPTQRFAARCQYCR